MKVLIANLILYTNETPQIKKVDSIKDTMIYNLCLAFKNEGHDITLAASDLYKPIKDENYPFKIVWLKTTHTILFPPNVFPCCPDIKKLIKYSNFDLIISSEVFSLCSFFIAQTKAKNLIIWQELAKHNNIFKKLASKIWYNLISHIVFKDTLIVPRSKNAKTFISHYLDNISDEIIDHGINTKKFIAHPDKKNQFSICSQLIKRKQIDKSIEVFAKYLKKYDNTTKLFIMGDGDQKNNLQELTKRLKIEDNVIFTGKLTHDELISILGNSMAMLVYTNKDNNMVSIVESIALATPIITTDVPYNSSYIKSNKLGVVKNDWNEDDLSIIASDKQYINNCLKYRKTLPCEYKVKQFVNIYNQYIK